MSTTVTSSKTFREFDLSEATLHSLEEMGYEHPTPVQQEASPLAIEGKVAGTVFAKGQRASAQRDVDGCLSVAIDPGKGHTNLISNFIAHSHEFFGCRWMDTECGVEGRFCRAGFECNGKALYDLAGIGADHV